MVYTLICYSKCSTCNKAKKWLLDQGIAFKEREIKTNHPTKEELKEWIDRSGLPVKKFFNTSGMLYKSMGLKDKLPMMQEEEQIDLLSTDGMLVKRPLLIGEDKILVGFKVDQWESIK